MGYRKIEVDGKEYQYTVGRTHLKVRGVGVATIVEAGSEHDMRCGCCGEPLRLLHENFPPETFRVKRVTPSDVAAFIRGHAHG